MADAAKSTPLSDSEFDDDEAALVYYDPLHPASFGGVHRLAKVLKDKSKSRTKKWLSAQDAYTLHRPVRRRFRRRRTIVRGPGVQVQADLMNWSSHAKHNDGNRFLLRVHKECFHFLKLLIANICTTKTKMFHLGYEA